MHFKLNIQEISRERKEKLVGPKVIRAAKEVELPNRRYYATTFVLESVYFFELVSFHPFDCIANKIPGVDRVWESRCDEFWVEIKPEGNWDEIEPQIFAALKETYELPELEFVVREVVTTE